jgi:hypothetical protein
MSYVFTWALGKLALMEVTRTSCSFAGHLHAMTSARAGGKRHAVVKPPVFACVSPETVEPARICSDAPVVINRHFETTASVDRQRRPWLLDQRAV